MSALNEKMVAFVLRAADAKGVIHAMVWHGAPHLPTCVTMCGLRLLPPVLHRAKDFLPGPDCCAMCRVEFKRAQE